MSAVDATNWYGLLITDGGDFSQTPLMVQSVGLMSVGILRKFYRVPSKLVLKVVKALLCAVIYRNGVNVEGATHKQVVDLIRSGGDTLVLTGI